MELSLQKFLIWETFFHGLNLPAIVELLYGRSISSTMLKKHAWLGDYIYLLIKNK